MVFDDDKWTKQNIDIEELKDYFNATLDKESDGLSTQCIRDYLKNICEKSDGLINRDSFLTKGITKNDSKREKYIFKPQTHQLLLLLLRYEYYERTFMKNTFNLNHALYMNNLLISATENLDEYSKKNPT